MDSGTLNPWEGRREWDEVLRGAGVTLLCVCRGGARDNRRGLRRDDRRGGVELVDGDGILDLGAVLVFFTMSQKESPEK